MRVLAFAASARKESLNRKLIALAAEVARAEGAEVDLAEFREFEMPTYDGDAEAAQGLPPGAVALRRRVEAADALLIAAPEYNFSISGALKNAIDWVSRGRPMPWRGRSVYLLSASPSPMGGIRGLWQTRVPLEGCGALVFPDMFALPHANQAFDEAGRLRDAKYAERLEREITGFVRLAETLVPACSAVRAGELPPRAREQIAVALDDAQEEAQPKVA
jgi:NAD(P)H-dependent FMN reductase